MAPEKTIVYTAVMTTCKNNTKK